MLLKLHLHWTAENALDLSVRLQFLTFPSTVEFPGPFFTSFDFLVCLASNIFHSKNGIEAAELYLCMHGNHDPKIVLGVFFKYSRIHSH